MASDSHKRGRDHKLPGLESPCWVQNRVNATLKISMHDHVADRNQDNMVHELQQVRQRSTAFQIGQLTSDRLAPNFSPHYSSYYVGAVITVQLSPLINAAALTKYGVCTVDRALRRSKSS